MNELRLLLDYGPAWLVLLAIGCALIAARFARIGRTDRDLERARAARRRRYEAAYYFMLPPNTGGRGASRVTAATPPKKATRG